MNAQPTESSEGDELLDRAITGLRDLPVPQGPSALTVDRTRARLNQHAVQDLPSRRLVLRPALLPLAAAIAILCASAAVYWFATHHQHPPIVQKDVTPTPVPGNPAPAPTNLNPTHVVPPIPAPVVKAPNPPAPATPAYADSVISGRVIYDGIPPIPAALPGVNLMPECEKAHGGPIYDESLVVNPDGTLANVVVSVSSGLSGWLRDEFPPPPGQAVLNQKGCVFEPHVVAVMVGEPLLIKNSDPFLHNVHVMAVNNPDANVGQPTIGELATEPFESPEVFRVKCDVHPWMQAWVRVVDNPWFAVTGRDGRFSLRGLPAGTYTLKAWHEQLGVREMQVTIGPDRGAVVDFTFKPIK